MSPIKHLMRLGREAIEAPGILGYLRFFGLLAIWLMSLLCPQIYKLYIKLLMFLCFSVIFWMTLMSFDGIPFSQMRGCLLIRSLSLLQLGILDDYILELFQRLRSSGGIGLQMNLLRRLILIYIAVFLSFFLILVFLLPLVQGRPRFLVKDEIIT